MLGYLSYFYMYNTAQFQKSESFVSRKQENHKPKGLKLISVNAAFNHFTYDSFARCKSFIEKVFTNGTDAVLLQDFPERYINSLPYPNTTYAYTYATGKNNIGSAIQDAGNISNVIICNPAGILANTSPQKQIYLPELIKTNHDFEAGSWVLEFSDFILGSVYDTFSSTAFHRKLNWQHREAVLTQMSCEKNIPFLVCGDFNPRTKYRVTNERPLIKTGNTTIDDFIYQARLLPFVSGGMIGLHKHFGPKDELLSARAGIISAPQGTMKPTKKFGVPMPVKHWVMDAVQTNIDPNDVSLQVVDNDFSDHFALEVDVHTSIFAQN
jgi:hypothetical protein